MQLTINDTNNLSELDIRILALLVPQKAQPAVAENTGTTALVTPPSTEGSGVSETTGAVGVPAADQPVVSTPEKKERKPRAKKEEVADAQVEKQDTAADADTSSGHSAPETGSNEEASDSAPSVTTAQADAKSLSLDEVRAALQLFTGKHGMQAAIKLLGEFGAGRISELKPEQYAAFAEKCGE